MPVPPPASPFPFRLDYPAELPISARAAEITAAIAAHPVIILAGETGSGKTTQIPKYCLAAGRGRQGKIACTQPRRVAALSVSRRVAEELGVAWGREVGCKVRFSDQTSSATVVKFLTDGMLLAEAQGDPLLRAYDTIIVDEAHERSLNIDFLLGHLRQLRDRRPDLKLVITSATIDTAVFSAAFGGAPVLTVEGRTFPVEVIYAPLDSFGSDADPAVAEAAEQAEALHYIDGAVEATIRLVEDSRGGDLLVFMPSERDIREVCEVLDGRLGRTCEVVALFGRLSNAEQQRVFAPSARRKVIVATNVAETSLTIPGIRFVVDTGLARISRYSPAARTRRLPIEEIAQSSADQRKGRSGRVADGVCVRLYSEADYLARPRFAAPEIQRANLADVILRLHAFGLGEVESFPFLSPPAPKAIRAGYALLAELGAVAPPERALPAGAGPAGPTLTAIGEELARLPVDPTVGRMILQARQERALREVLVIAAGLSIQDPRERPLEQQAQADAAHRRFVHPDSDFLTLLNIWEAYHDQFESLSQAKLRRFCRDHFLSYARLREWRDVHTQLLEVLQERRDFRLTSVADGIRPSAADPLKTGFGTPAYRAIHRSILAGLLGNVAVRDEENGGYKATHDRRVVLFPGSVLFRRESRPNTKSSGPVAKPAGSRLPRWLMAAEIVETSRLYARTCARLDPAWALELGAHLVRVAHSEPFWDAAAGRVCVKQRTRLYGLELEHRAVSYGRIDPAAATEIFIREALVNDVADWPLEFLNHNRGVREAVAGALTRSRHRGTLNLDEAVYRFYAARLPPELVGPAGLSSVAELAALVRARRAAEPDFLHLRPDDLQDPEVIATDPQEYPAELPLENRAIPLTYAYRPGQADDGVTIDVSLAEAPHLTEAALDWAVPGHLEPKVEHYLRALPKELRRSFVPLAESARQLAAALRRRERPPRRLETVAEALAQEIQTHFAVGLDPSIWAGKPPPDYLRVRVRVVDRNGRELATGRELDQLGAALAERAQAASASVAREDPAGWRRVQAQWEKPPQTAWTFGDIPRQVPVADQAGLEVMAFPALQAESGGVALRLLRSEPEARAATRRGLAALLEGELRYDLGWFQRDLRGLRELGALSATLEPLPDLQAEAFDCVRAWVCAADRWPEDAGAPALTAASFAAACARGRAELRGAVPRLVELLREILRRQQELLVHPQPYPGLEDDLADLVAPGFLRAVPFDRLEHFARYLQGRQLRADRWRKNPVKDAERAQQLAPYVAAERARRSAPGGSGALRWLVEEFRISLFAQELGTAESVSAVKLDQALGQGPPTAGARVAAVAPAPRLAVIADKKGAPLKSLGALDKWFPR